MATGRRAGAGPTARSFKTRRALTGQDEGTRLEHGGAMAGKNRGRESARFWRRAGLPGWSCWRPPMWTRPSRATSTRATPWGVIETRALGFRYWAASWWPRPGRSTWWCPASRTTVTPPVPEAGPTACSTWSRRSWPGRRGTRHPGSLPHFRAESCATPPGPRTPGPAPGPGGRSRAPGGPVPAARPALRLDRTPCRGPLRPDPHRQRAPGRAPGPRIPGAHACEDVSWRTRPGLPGSRPSTSGVFGQPRA
jgi:hypothetical protein